MRGVQAFHESDPEAGPVRYRAHLRCLRRWMRGHHQTRQPRRKRGEGGLPAGARGVRVRRRAARVRQEARRRAQSRGQRIRQRRRRRDGGSHSRRGGARASRRPGSGGERRLGYQQSGARGRRRGHRQDARRPPRGAAPRAPLLGRHPRRPRQARIHGERVPTGTEGGHLVRRDAHQRRHDHRRRLQLRRRGHRARRVQHRRRGRHQAPLDAISLLGRLLLDTQLREPPPRRQARVLHAAVALVVRRRQRHQAPRLPALTQREVEDHRQRNEESTARFKRRAHPSCTRSSPAT